MNKELEIAFRVLVVTSNSVAQNYHYNLSDEALCLVKDSLIEYVRQINFESLISLSTKDELFSIGFGRFDGKLDSDGKELLLIPLWIWDSVPNWIELFSIDGKVINKSANTDLDTRFGCVAFGIKK